MTLFYLAICQMVIDRLLWLLVAIYIDFLCKIIFSPHNIIERLKNIYEAMTDHVNH